ncbi:NAD-dependent epimerase/dehydratase family protein [Flavobacterium sp.]|uniref:NAD-dependent epimerase/dehydratase family protein n=1 Tax=Flavobacterium sp. TaxID=239 RepID=UPI00374CB84B
MKQVLITGAYGFLGRNVSKYFHDAGCHVTGIGHGKWDQDEYLNWGVDCWVESTITFESLININKIFDIIIHCGGSGSVGFSTQNPYEDFQKSVQSTLSVLEYIRLRNPGCKFIYPSSVAVQGSLPDAKIEENTIGNPISPYGFHKKIAEELCQSYHINYGLEIGIVRFFSIYGVGLEKQLLYDACKKLSSKNEDEAVFFGMGTETRDWIHVLDAASLIFKFVEKLKGMDIINGGSGERTEIGTVINILNNEFNNAKTIRFNGIVRQGDPKYFWADVNHVSRYNWQPSLNLSDGLREYVKYFKKSKNG